MALIKCPSCGKEISNKAGKCPHCEQILKELEYTVPYICPECKTKILDTDEVLECPNCGCPVEKKRIKKNQIVNRIKKNKKFITIGIIVMITVIIAFSIVNHRRYSLNEDEKYVYENAMRLKDMMKNPDSFKIYEYMALIKHYDENKKLEYTYTIIEYGGSNNYGAITKDEAIFKNRKYVMNYSDELDKSDSDFLDKSLVKLGVLSAMTNEAVPGKDAESWEYIEIDTSKIKHKMKMK